MDIITAEGGSKARKVSAALNSIDMALATANAIPVVSTLTGPITQTVGWLKLFGLMLAGFPEGSAPLFRSGVANLVTGAAATAGLGAIGYIFNGVIAAKSAANVVNMVSDDLKAL